jgi:hypothetical protein
VIAAYRERLRAREATLAELEARDTNFSRARLAVFLGFLALVVAAWQWTLPWVVLAVPVVLFIALVAVHDRTLRRRDAARRAVAHYRDGLDRCADRWASKGASTSTPASLGVRPDHPYAADLDLFGPASLFELLSRARSRAGEQRLAGWLTVHAERRVEVETIRARQRSVIALTPQLDLREDLAVLGVSARVEVRPEALIDWGSAPPLFPASARRTLAIAGIAIPIATALAIAAWVLGFGPYALIAVLAVAGLIHKRYEAILARVIGPADRHGHELEVLAALFERIEAERFEDPALATLQRAVRDDARGLASVAIARLRALVGWYEAQRNPLFIPLALALVWGPNFALAIERWRAEQGPRVAAWLDALAELEALASLASHAYENPDDPFPELVDEATPLLVGEGLGHPLLARTECVRNDLRLVGPVRAHVISGSNMSGKSTFLRTVGSNVVLALAGAPVRAASLRLTPVRIGATLRVQDSLHEGASRFWAELTRLRTVSELADADPTLFLLDEIFHGTNSHDRRIGAEALLRSLVDRGAIGLLTTHDLALAKAAEALAPAATNVHFEDELREGELVFDYKMRPGVVQKSNALALMRSVGLDV